MTCDFDILHIVTPVDVHAYQTLLKKCKYDQVESNFLVDRFTNGFALGPRNIKRFSLNLKLECGDQRTLWDKVMKELMKEVKLKQFAGPFDRPPFQHFIQSSLGLVPKGEAGTRLIFHLSYPRGGDSVNSLTPKVMCTVSYKDLEHAIAMCLEAGKGCFVAKSVRIQKFTYSSPGLVFIGHDGMQPR